MIDSVSLRGSRPELLKSDIFEGQDYVLVPFQIAANFLIKKYKATSNTFIRSVVNMGTNENKLLQIELYPIELHYYICTKDKPTVGPNDTPSVKLVSRAEDVNKFMSTLKPPNKMTMQVRFWLKTNEIPVAAPAGALGGRLMTPDVTDRDGHWLCMQNIQKGKFTFSDFVDDQLRIDAIFEIYEQPAMVTVRFNNIQDYSPRAVLLHAWKKALEVGDVIDVQHQTKMKFFEAVVSKEVTEDGNLHVHFLGFGVTYDQVIKKADIAVRVAPLNSVTVNWRQRLSKAIDDSTPVKVDINVEESGFAAHWLTGTVEEVDLVNSRVKVTISQTEWDNYQISKTS